MRYCTAIVLVLSGLGGCGGEHERTPAMNENASSVSSAGVSLTPRFRVGESSVYQMDEITRQAQTTSLHGVTRVITESRRFRLETRSVDEEGGAVLRLTMERIVSSVTDNGQTIFSFDSDMATNDESPPSVARRVLSTLIADVRLAPGGTVVTMAANLTPADLQSVPPSARALLGENWFRAAVESIYRPLGERASVPVGETWSDSAPPGPPFTAEGNVLQTTSGLVEHDDESVVILAETILFIGGEPAPNTFSRRSRYRWSLSDGRLDQYDQSEMMTIEGMLAGIASAEAAEREISLRRVNPTPPNDEESPTSPADR